eukprot:6192806-Pleurochrysis_carterae.AAC.1
MIFEVLKQAGYDEAFMSLPKVRRHVAKKVIRTQQSHWGARLAVHISLEPPRVKPISMRDFATSALVRVQPPRNKYLWE